MSDDRVATDMFAWSRGNIKTVEFSGPITYIGARSFDGFTGLENLSNKTVLIPDTVTSIGSYAFRNCTSMSSITIPDGVVTIGNGAFQNDTAATVVTFGRSVETIGDDAFNNCSKLPKIIFSEGIKSIGHRAFRECTSLTEVYLPSTLTYISHWTDGDATFYNCRNIQKITVPQYVTGSRDLTYVFYYSRGKIKDIYLDSNVTSITSNGLSGFSDVTLHFKGSIPSGAPWGGSNVKTVQG